MSKLEILKQVPLFAGLEEEDLSQLAELCRQGEAAPHQFLIHQNTTGSEMYIIAGGAVEVFIEGLTDERSLVVLGQGQVVGEMALIDYGYRSASARATEQGCRYYLIERDPFHALCRSNVRLGFTVMRNMAVDLAFKLRHRNLTAM